MARLVYATRKSALAPAQWRLACALHDRSPARIGSHERCDRVGEITLGVNVG